MPCQCIHYTPNALAVRLFNLHKYSKAFIASTHSAHKRYSRLTIDRSANNISGVLCEVYFSESVVYVKRPLDPPAHASIMCLCSYYYFKATSQRRVVAVGVGRHSCPHYRPPPTFRPLPSGATPRAVVALRSQYAARHPPNAH